MPNCAFDHLVSNLGYLKRQEDNICRAMYGASMNDVLEAMRLQWASDGGSRQSLTQPTGGIGPQQVAYSVDSANAGAPSTMATPDQRSSMKGMRAQVFEALTRVSNSPRKMSKRDIATAKGAGRTIDMVDVNSMQGGDDGSRR